MCCFYNGSAKMLVWNIGGTRCGIGASMAGAAGWLPFPVNHMKQ